LLERSIACPQLPDLFSDAVSDDNLNSSCNYDDADRKVDGVANYDNNLFSIAIAALLTRLTRYG